MNTVLNKDILKPKFDQEMERHIDKRSAILPLMHITQREFGWVSPEAEQYMADFLELPVARIHEVLTFYTMFNRKPVGRHTIYVCKTLACMLMGADDLGSYLSNKLGIKVGETTADGKFTLLAAECLGNCEDAPMMQVDDDYHGKLTPEKIDKILAELK